MSTNTKSNPSKGCIFVLNVTRILNSKSSLYNHKRVHSGMKSHCCQVRCKFQPVSLTMYNEHIWYGHLVEKICKSEECGKKFQTPSKMCSHRNRVHEPVHPRKWVLNFTNIGDWFYIFCLPHKEKKACSIPFGFAM